MPRKGWNSVTINEKTNKLLEEEAKKTGQSKSKIAEEAIVEHISKEA